MKDNKKQIKVLHVMACGDIGGISSVVLNYYRHIDKDKVHFDVALVDSAEGRDAMVFRSLGSEIYHIPRKRDDKEKYKKELGKIILDGKYDFIHVHENETSYVALKVAKDLGIKGRIAHSHTSSNCESIRDNIRRWSGIVLNEKYATKLIACGQLAGDRVFGKRNMRTDKAIILPNAIDIDMFRYNEMVRNEIRERYSLEDKKVLLFVGRLSPEKNLEFLIDVVVRVYANNPDVMTLIVGSGEEHNNLETLIKANNAQDYIKLLGARNDVNDLMNASDVLLLPSIHEGFPVVAVEAMASGLPLFVSDAVTRELDFYPSIYYLSLKNAEVWESKIRDVLQDEHKDRISRDCLMKKHGFDIKDSARILQDIYEKDVDNV